MGTFDANRTGDGNEEVGNVDRGRAPDSPLSVIVKYEINIGYTLY